MAPRGDDPLDPVTQSRINADAAAQEARKRAEEAVGKDATRPSDVPQIAAGIHRLKQQQNKAPEITDVELEPITDKNSSANTISLQPQEISSEIPDAIINPYAQYATDDTNYKVSGETKASHDDRNSVNVTMNIPSSSINAEKTTSIEPEKAKGNNPQQAIYDKIMSYARPKGYFESKLPLKDRFWLRALGYCGDWGKQRQLNIVGNKLGEGAEVAYADIKGIELQEGSYSITRQKARTPDKDVVETPEKAAVSQNEPEKKPTKEKTPKMSLEDFQAQIEAYKEKPPISWWTAKMLGFGKSMSPTLDSSQDAKSNGRLLRGELGSDEKFYAYMVARGKLSAEQAYKLLPKSGQKEKTAHVHGENCGCPEHSKDPAIRFLNENGMIKDYQTLEEGSREQKSAHARAAEMAKRDPESEEGYKGDLKAFQGAVKAWADNGGKVPAPEPTEKKDAFSGQRSADNNLGVDGKPIVKRYNFAQKNKDGEWEDKSYSRDQLDFDKQGNPIGVKTTEAAPEATAPAAPEMSAEEAKKVQFKSVRTKTVEPKAEENAPYASILSDHEKKPKLTGSQEWDAYVAKQRGVEAKTPQAETPTVKFEVDTVPQENLPDHGKSEKEPIQFKAAKPQIMFSREQKPPTKPENDRDRPRGLSLGR